MAAASSGRLHRELDRARPRAGRRHRGRRPCHGRSRRRSASRGGSRPPTTQRHERSEGLVQPDPVPPAHRHEIAKPHVRDLVLDDLGEALQLGPGGVVRIREQDCLAEGHAAEVLHRSRREIGDRDEVELLAGVGNGEVARVEAQRMLRRSRARPPSDATSPVRGSPEGGHRPRRSPQSPRARRR